jgi:phosphate transport system substrate-binding protein
MKTPILVLAAVLFIIITSGCKNEDDIDPEEFYIPELTMENYPVIDGSTSTEPLHTVLACELFGISYTWIAHPWDFEYPYHVWPSANENHVVASFLNYRATNHTGTHQSYVNLLNSYADLILVARSASADELHMADSLNVSLMEAPVALDALIFLVNVQNPANSLSTQQIKDIYTGKITNWSEVGGEYIKLNAYTRERNSGSQELMESLMMKNLTMHEFPDMMIMGMMGLINMIETDQQGLGYSVNYYTRYMIRSDYIKIIDVDGIAPNNFNMQTRKYGYTAEVYAVIRENTDRNSMAFKIFELLQKPSGQAVVAKSGYVPYW